MFIIPQKFWNGHHAKPKGQANHSSLYENDQHHERTILLNFFPFGGTDMHLFVLTVDTPMLGRREADIRNK